MIKLQPAIAKTLLPFLALITLLPVIGPALALGMGIAYACLFHNPYQAQTEKLPKQLLAWCVIGLGGGMNLIEVLEVGARGFVYTAISIVLTLLLALGIARLLKLEKKCATLIGVGTAICGGSAIAAIAPVINARSGSIAVSLAVVFVLNALALMIFPSIGHSLGMDQHAFGLWSALAIHDTSSVVGAGLQYGEEALQTGTSVKLARALWIVPLVFAVQAIYAKTTTAEPEAPKRKYPWFILGFLTLAALVTYVPATAGAGQVIAEIARRGLVLTLFLIGANLHPAAIKSAGAKPLIFGVVLWAIVSLASLAAIQSGLIS